MTRIETHCAPPVICECMFPELVFVLSGRHPHITCKDCGAISSEKADMQQLVASALGPDFVPSIDATNATRNRRGSIRHD